MTKLIHCSYHKNLTVYAGRVFQKAFIRFGSGYGHFNSHKDQFLANLANLSVASLNNHALTFDEVGEDVLISRFVRDPRDLVVSGYFYHKRGAEPWSRVEKPTPRDFAVVNGVIDPELGNRSFAGYLSELSTEEGLLAELRFRARHFESMRDWLDDDRILVQRYEDILGDEVAAFGKIADHFGLSFLRSATMRYFANRYRAGRRSNDGHIRNPKKGQWRDVLPPSVQKKIAADYGDVLERYGYPAE